MIILERSIGGSATDALYISNQYYRARRYEILLLVCYKIKVKNY
jgi:hypothetical protein